MNDEKAVAWLREQVLARKTQAEAATPGPWHSWIEGRDGLGGDSFVMTEGEDLYPHVDVGGKDYNPNWEADQDFIATNDPRQIIADCEKDLAILDEHEEGEPEELRHGHWEGHGSNERWVRDEPNDCPVCATWIHGSACMVEAPCSTVKAVASGYRYYPGYGEHWGTE